MTISCGPDEDADNLDDESLLKAYLGLQPGQAAPQAIPSTELPEWPDNPGASASLEIDAATLNWFQTRHADWKHEINLVLRAWVAHQSETGLR